MLPRIPAILLVLGCAGLAWAKGRPVVYEHTWDQLTWRLTVWRISGTAVEYEIVSENPAKKCREVLHGEAELQMETNQSAGDFVADTYLHKDGKRRIRIQIDTQTGKRAKAIVEGGKLPAKGCPLTVVAPISEKPRKR